MSAMQTQGNFDVLPKSGPSANTSEGLNSILNFLSSIKLHLIVLKIEEIEEQNSLSFLLLLRFLREKLKKERKKIL